MADSGTSQTPLAAPAAPRTEDQGAIPSRSEPDAERENLVRPESEPEPEPVGPVHSVLGLVDGPERRLRWDVGSGCPDELRAELLAQRGADGRLSPESLSWLPRWLTQAGAAGHELRVEAEVWSMLAWQQERQERVQRLERALAVAPLATRLREPLPDYQWEAALFAVAAGRALLADDLGLGQQGAAIAALALWRQVFGLDSALIVVPAERLEEWRHALQRQQVSGGHTLCTPETLRGDEAPELLIVDAAAGQSLAPLRRIPAQHLLLLSDRELVLEPAVLLPLVEWLDNAHMGPLARLQALLAQPARPGPRELRAALETVMLSRRRRELALPERLERTIPVVAPASLHVVQALQLPRSKALLARWQARGWLGAGERIELLTLVAQLLQLARVGAAAEAKLEAVLALLPHIVPAAAERLLVLARDEALLAPLRERLLALGLEPLGPEQAQFWSQQRGALLLATDAQIEGLSLDGVASGLLALDLPWNPALRRARAARLGARGVPVWQCVLEGSLEAGLLDAHESVAEVPGALLDSGAGLPWLDDASLPAFAAILGAALVSVAR